MLTRLALAPLGLALLATGCSTPPMSSAESGPPVTEAEARAWIDRMEGRWQLVEQRLLQDGETVHSDPAVEGEIVFAPVLRGEFLHGTGVLSRGDDRVEWLTMWCHDDAGLGIRMWHFSDIEGVASGFARPDGNELHFAFQGVEEDGDRFVGRGVLRFESQRRIVWSWSHRHGDPGLLNESVFERSAP